MAITDDREKVLKGLECWATNKTCSRKECTYIKDGGWERENCSTNLMADALAWMRFDGEHVKFLCEEIDRKNQQLQEKDKKYQALMEAYDCARVKLENANTGNFYTIKRGHARYGFCSSEGRIFFVVYAADKEMPMGELPEGHEENRKTVAGFYLHDAEEVRMLGKYFLKFAAALEEHPEWGGNDDGITDCERSTRDDGADRDGGV